MCADRTWEAAIRKTHKVYSDCIDIAWLGEPAVCTVCTSRCACVPRQGLYSVQNICQTGM